MFQSLIGRLKTEVEKILDELNSRFQSLIGRLKTKILENIKKTEGWFQSLIGRLKTKMQLIERNPLQFGFNPL